MEIWVQSRAENRAERTTAGCCSQQGRGRRSVNEAVTWGGAEQAHWFCRDFNLIREEETRHIHAYVSLPGKIIFPLESIQLASQGLYFPRATLHRASIGRPQEMLLTFMLMTFRKQAGYREKKRSHFMTIAQSFPPARGELTLGHACNKSQKGDMVIHFLRVPYFTGSSHLPSISWRATNQEISLPKEVTMTSQLCLLEPRALGFWTL